MQFDPQGARGRKLRKIGRAAGWGSAGWVAFVAGQAECNLGKIAGEDSPAGKHNFSVDLQCSAKSLICICAWCNGRDHFAVATEGGVQTAIRLDCYVSGIFSIHSNIRHDHAIVVETGVQTDASQWGHHAQGIIYRSNGLVKSGNRPTVTGTPDRTCRIRDAGHINPIYSVALW